MRYHCLAPLVAAVASVFLGAIVLRQGVRERLNRTFAYMALTHRVWNLGIFALDFFPDPDQAEFWSRIFRVGICLGPPATAHFALVFNPPRRRWVWPLLAAYYAAGVLLAILNLRGDLVSGVTPHPGLVRPADTTLRRSIWDYRADVRCLARAQPERLLPPPFAAPPRTGKVLATRRGDARTIRPHKRRCRVRGSDVPPG